MDFPTNNRYTGSILFVKDEVLLKKSPKHNVTFLNQILQYIV